MLFATCFATTRDRPCDQHSLHTFSLQPSGLKHQAIPHHKTLRQPLDRVELVLADKSLTAAIEACGSLIAEELNVKAVQLLEHADEFVRYEVKPNFRSIGPKFGKLAKAIQARTPADTAALDLARARRALQQLGRRMLLELVEGAPYPAHALAGPHLAPLEAWLEPDEIERLTRALAGVRRAPSE